MVRLDFEKITLPQQQVKPFIENIPREMCSSREYQYPPHGWSLEILRGVGVSKANIFKGKYEVKLEIPEGEVLKRGKVLNVTLQRNAKSR